jgi:hypothetical protein
VRGRQQDHKEGEQEHEEHDESVQEGQQPVVPQWVQRWRREVAVAPRSRLLLLLLRRCGRPSSMR